MILTNDLLRLEFDPVSGALRGLRSLRDGHDHLPDPRAANLFRLIVPSARWDSRYAEASQQTARLEPRGETLTIHYDQLKCADGETLAIRARVTVTLPPGSPEARCELFLNNDSAVPITEVQFPLVGGWTGYAGAGKDQLLLGAGQRGFIDPHARLGEPWTTFENLHQRTSNRFPLGTFVPWLDLSGGGRGLWLINYMQQPRVSGSFAVNTRGHEPGLALMFGWFFHPEIRPGASWSSGVLGLGVHEGDWHATARHYREWLQTWWQPAAVPSRLRSAFAVQSMVFNTFEGRPVRPFKALPAIAREALRYGVRDLCVWDGYMLGTYARLDPRPLTDYPPAQWEELRQALTESRDLGCYVSLLMNHRVVSQQSDFFRQHGAAAALRVRDGSLRIETYPLGSHTAEHWTNWRGPQAAVMCQRSEEFRRTVNYHLDRLMDVGFNAFFIDQPFENLPCYAPGHGHASPDDTHAAIPEWIGDFRKRFRQRHPDGYIIGEMPDPFVGQVIDLWWNWMWRRDQAQVDMVAYSLPGLLNGWVSDRDHGAAQQAFLHGFLALLTTRGSEGTLGDDPAWGEYIGRLSALRARTAHCTTAAQFEDQVGLTCEGADAKRFTSAVVIANPTDKPTTAKVQCDQELRAGKLYRLNGSTEVRGAGASLELALEPRDVVVWEAQHAS